MVYLARCRSIVRALEYVTITRLEIGYVVNKVCQFVSNPAESLNYTKDNYDISESNGSGS